MPAGFTIVLAFDNDAGGDKLAQDVEEIARSARLVRHRPPVMPRGKDWNDLLRIRERDYILEVRRSQDRGLRR
jgi:DNA primase